MAHQPVALNRIGLGAAALVALLLLVPLAVVALRSDTGAGLSPGDWAAIRFTVMQAALSAVISVALAIPVARALARRQFPGRGLLITLLGAPFFLPVIVAILGLLAIFGRNGVLNAVLEALSLPQVNIYGLTGVILAHVFLNLPLATRLLLQGWQALPAEQFRLAASVQMTPQAVFRAVEWPMLRRLAPGIIVVIWLICMTSFAVALTLGGGPRATTVELAIYQAIRFDFELGRAALLSLVQVALCLGLAVLSWRLAGDAQRLGGMGRLPRRWDAPTGLRRSADALAIGLAALFLLLPLGAVVIDGIAGLDDLTISTAHAALRSVVVALGSAAIATGLALAVALRGGRVGALIGALPLAISSLVLGTGMFLMIRSFTSPTSLALPVTAIINALLTLPFALRAMRPSIEATQAEYGALSASLNLTAWTWFRWVLLPRLRQPLGFSAGIAAAFSMGDLGVITLFATNGQETLPLHMYRLMGAYRLEAAAGASLCLVVLTLSMLWMFDLRSRHDTAL